MSTMNAAVFVETGRLEITERPLPSIRRPDEVLLDIEACGICGTDLHILSDPPGHPATLGSILGHEFVARVRDVGAECGTLVPGDRVVVNPIVSCAVCRWCQRGLPNHCDDFSAYGVFMDGGLASQAVVRAANCFRIADDVPPHVAALAEPLATVVNGARVAAVVPGDAAVVIGAGPIGLMFSALLQAAGAEVVAIEPTERRAALASRFGAVRVVDPAREEAVAAVREATGGLGADVVVDAVGSQLATALGMVRKAGRIVLFGMNAHARSEVAQVDITRGELTITGAYVGLNQFPRAVRLLEAGAIDFGSLVSHRVSLPQMPTTVEELRAGRAVKVVIEF